MILFLIYDHTVFKHETHHFHIDTDNSPSEHTFYHSRALERAGLKEKHTESANHIRKASVQ